MRRDCELEPCRAGHVPPLGRWPTRVRAEWTLLARFAYVSICVRIHHLALGARDVASLAEFYRRAFDLREHARHLHADGSLRSVWLDLEGPLLMNGATVVLVALTLAIAVFAGPLYDLSLRAAEGLADPTAYTQAVLGR